MLKSLVKRHLKTIHDKVSGSLRERELRKTTRTVSSDELCADLEGLGLAAGDTVFVHSSLKSLGYIPGGAVTILDSLVRVLGRDGTLIVPVYHLPGGTIHATCQMKGYVFDPRVAGTELGALPAAFLKMPSVERSIHPTHSVAAVGKHARYVTEAHHLAPSIFGTGSPWDRCWDLDGKVLGLGISMGPVTFYHLLEDRLGDDFPLPVRMRETFHLHCRDWDGRPITVPVVPLDPRMMPQRIDHRDRVDLRDYFWREFKRAGLLRSAKMGEGQAWYIHSRAFYSHLVELCQEGITIYSKSEDLAARPLPAAPEHPV